jgi:hypothetical protein
MFGRIGEQKSGKNFPQFFKGESQEIYSRIPKSLLTLLFTDLRTILNSNLHK